MLIWSANSKFKIGVLHMAEKKLKITQEDIMNLLDK